MSIGSIDIYLDGPVEVGLNDGNGEPFAVVELSQHPGRAYIAVRTVAEADALIKAAVAAKDLLLGALHDGIREGLAAADRGDTVDLGSFAQYAELPPGHGENHIDNAGHATLATGPCEPGRCTCGGTVNAAGVFTPAGVS